MAREVLPRSIADRIAFFEQRLPIWAASHAEIGLDASDIVALDAVVSQARAAFEEAQEARSLARAKTLLQDEALAAMLAVARAQVRVVRAHAAKTRNPAVFAAAQIPAPNDPAPLGPAQTPTGLTSRLLTGGAVELVWQGSRTGGTSFHIHRSLVMPGGSGSAYALIGTSEERRYVDTTVPYGLQQAAYVVVAVRSGGRSEPSDPTTIFFGTGAGNPIAHTPTARATAA